MKDGEEGGGVGIGEGLELQSVPILNPRKIVLARIVCLCLVMTRSKKANIDESLRQNAPIAGWGGHFPD